MSYFYCDTCQKTLPRNEQRHNKEQISKQRPMIIGQLNNLPGHPLLAVPLRSDQTINVVRCTTCGSDARFCYTPEEQAQMRRQQQANGKTIVVVILIIILVILMLRFVFDALPFYMGTN